MVEILNVSNLSTAFQSDYGSKQALKNISFRINEGEVLALVGESGSGKTVTSLSIMGLLPNNAYIQEGNINLIDKLGNIIGFRECLLPCPTLLGRAGYPGGYPRISAARCSCHFAEPACQGRISAWISTGTPGYLRLL